MSSRFIAKNSCMTESFYLNMKAYCGGRQRDYPGPDQLANAIAEERLLLEEILKSLACIVRSRGGGGGRSTLGVGYGRSVLFDGHAQLVKGAIVFRILFCNALRNRLRALELFSGIEMNALLARVQLEMAARTLAVGVHTRCKNSSAARTTRTSHRSDHARRAGPEHVLLGARFAGMIAALRALAFLFCGIAVRVSLLPILPLHEILLRVIP